MSRGFIAVFCLLVHPIFASAEVEASRSPLEPLWLAVNRLAPPGDHSADLRRRKFHCLSVVAITG
jgi:hypothetical protein